MSMISFAQNFEDVVLMRALKDIEAGFYVDVGAFSPHQHSVTKVFYDRGWHGINVEPNPECEAVFKESRPRDINLAVAVGDTPGRMKLKVFSDTGLSTLDTSIASGHVASGRVAKDHEVRIVTLDEIFREHIGPDTEVHFVKIDVEGFEAQVIRGKDWTTRRPWIVMVEATLPLTQVASHLSWEPSLLAADYIHAYSDGLNRFYVAREHEHLASKLAVPPNVFDDFRIIALVEAEQGLEQAEAALREAGQRLEVARSAAADSSEAAMQSQKALEDLQVAMNQLAGRAEEIDRRYHQVAAELDLVYRSRSWRASYPLRLGSLATSDVLNGLPATRAKSRRLARRIAVGLASRGATLIKRNPVIYAHTVAWLHAHPALLFRVQRLLHGAGDPASLVVGHGPVQTRQHPPSVAELPRGARDIYLALREAIQKNRGR